MLTPSNFLAEIYHGAPESGIYCLWGISAGHIEARYFSCGQYDEMASAALQMGNEKGTNTFFRVSVLKEKPKEGRGKETDSIGASALWIDLDVYRSKKSIEQATDALVTFRLPPSIIVHSGSGLHAYWLLESFTFDLAHVKESNRWLGDQFAAYGADSTFDVARVMRFPGTLNYKTEEPKQVSISSSPGHKYKLDDFERSLVSPAVIDFEGIEPEPVNDSLLDYLKSRDPKLYSRILTENSARENGATMVTGTPRVDRSLNDWYIACTLLKWGLTPGQCFSTLTHPEWFSGSKFRERQDYRYVIRTIEGAQYHFNKYNAVRMVEGRAVKPSELGATILNGTEYLKVEGNPLRVYRNGVFVPDGQREVERTIIAALGTSWTPSRAEGTVKYIEQYTSHSTDEVDLAGDYINVKNGMLDPETLHLHPHGPGYKSLIQIPVHYDQTADPTELDNFLASILPADCIDLWWEYVGFILMPEYRYKALLLLTGPTDSGKSQLIDLISYFVGEDNVSAVDLREIADRPFSVASLHGKLVNCCADIGTGIELVSIERMKKLVGYDAVDGERKFESPFRFRSRAKFIFSANGFPPMRKPDEAIFGRFLVIPCPNRFIRGVNTRVHIGREMSLVAENLSAMLNRALEGRARLVKRGVFDDPLSSQIETRKFQVEVDSVVGFWDERTIAEEGYTLPRQAVYDYYRDWCTDTGRSPQSSPNFIKRTVDLSPKYGITEAYTQAVMLDRMTRTTYCYIGRKILTNKLDANATSTSRLAVINGGRS